MRVVTTRFDAVEVDDDKIITFPLGMAGFEDLKRYFLLAHKDPIKWLQAVDDPDVAFIITEPFGLFPDYSFNVHTSVEEFLEVKSVDDILVFVILSVNEGKLTANLRAPIVINFKNMRAAQVLLEDDRVPVRFYINIPAK
ncbi:MAG: flagellar assembly protein FliW [Candidatus Magnetoovum sp. WYHC-5]|nr:flagellar assembly protein FliW [Candidatus Magnetoovum sp. WYHC-5]